MSNITIAWICLAVFSFCTFAGCILYFFAERLDQKREHKVDRLLHKLEELDDLPSCGPRFNNKRYVSVEWMTNYLKKL